jgi:hypothetical protein
MDCIEGGPADREGDELVEIDGILLALLLRCLFIAQ